MALACRRANPRNLPQKFSDHAFEHMASPVLAGGFDQRDAVELRDGLEDTHVAEPRISDQLRVLVVLREMVSVALRICLTFTVTPPRAELT